MNCQTLEEVVNMMKFTYQFDEKSPLVEVTLDSSSTLGEIFTSFEGFLKASGYAFDGDIDIVVAEEGTFERTK